MKNLTIIDNFIFTKKEVRIQWRGESIKIKRFWFWIALAWIYILGSALHYNLKNKNKHECNSECIHIPLKVEDNVSPKLLNAGIERCPFGDEAPIFHNAINDIERQGLKWSIDCRTSDCPQLLNKWYNTSEEAIKTWNKNAVNN